MEKIKFSVLIPVYNVECYLDRCIQSVLNQTYQNFEIILVNDGSTDNSGNICNFYAEKYYMIKAFHKENMGQLHTREFAIAHATGDFYVFLDSDDTLRQDAIETIYSTIKKYKCDCVIFGINKVINGQIVEVWADMETCCIEDKRTLYKKVFLSDKYNSMCRKAIRASVFSSVDYTNLYYLRHAEDLIQSLDVLKNSDRVCFICDALYNYNINSNSVSNSVNYENYSIDFTVQQKVLDFLMKEKVFSDEDFSDYKCYCVQLLINEIIRIGCFSVKYVPKIQLFKQIRNNVYYRSFLQTPNVVQKDIGLRKILFDLFRKENDVIIILVIGIVKKLKDSIRFLR